MSTTSTKRSHAQALKDAEAFRALFLDPAHHNCPSYVRWEFAGSLRRQKREVGDVEHLIIPAFGEPENPGLFGERTLNLLWKRLEELVDGSGGAGECRRHIYGETGFRWGPKYRGVDFRGHLHELWTAGAENWANQLVIRTGPAEFSRRVVSGFNRGGMYQQVDGYLVHVASGERVACRDEREYLRLAGLPWIEPRDRR